jgi:hypothetical protein
MTTITAMRSASVVTALNVLVATGFSVAAIINQQYLVPAAVLTEGSLLLAMYAAAPRIPLALLVLGAVYKQSTPALLILGTLAGAMQLLDAGIGLFAHDPGKCAGPLFIAVLQFFVVYLLQKSVRIIGTDQVRYFQFEGERVLLDADTSGERCGLSGKD